MDIEELQNKLDEEINRRTCTSPNKEKVWRVIQNRISLMPEVSFYSRTLQIRVLGIVAVIALVAGFCLSFLFYNNNDKPQAMAVFSPSGQKTQLLLPDGTHVWLNGESSLTYPSDYNVDNRMVKLEGEAFFDVSQSKDIPFIVEANNVHVKVHGTMFNVKAYPSDKEITVALQKGSVSLLSASTGELITYLKPDEIAVVEKLNLAYEVLSCDAASENIWHLNKLSFDNILAYEVWKKLERWYGVHIDVKNVKPELTYRFTIKTESLTELLSLINRITPIEYKLNGEEVTVKYK
ncbi:anti-sigma factor [Bacteroidia bacterium]|nr:anti-sigma factor [Bacteroidia bacterium]GHU55283.1 anti-sigma factor [Bacteroidia bacterium]